MTQVFDEKGKVTPVTLVEAGPCKVLQVKTKKKDGYNAVQLGFKKKKKNIKKTEKGKEYLFKKEFKSIEEFKLGDEILIDSFKEGDNVKISGISKGKGYQGGVKRWGFSGRGASHGVKHEARTLGSVGSAFPQRVQKGRKMPGRTGFQRKTIKNLKVIRVDKERNLLAISGALPGRRGTLLEIRSSD